MRDKEHCKELPYQHNTGFAQEFRINYFIYFKISQYHVVTVSLENKHCGLEYSKFRIYSLSLPPPPPLFLTHSLALLISINYSVY